MPTEHLVKMANQIGAFFEAMPDREEALEGIANHLKKFWEPRMRRDFLARIDAGKVVNVHPLLLAAVQQHRQLVE